MADEIWPEQKHTSEVEMWLEPSDAVVRLRIGTWGALVELDEQAARELGLALVELADRAQALP